MSLATIVNHRLPDPARRVAIQALGTTFAQVMGVESPEYLRYRADEALEMFREFTAACIEEALAHPQFARAKRAELEEAAYELGSKVRQALSPKDDEVAALVSHLYEAIDIDVRDIGDSELLFRHCYFAERYSPQVCAFMGAFDSGFVGGLYGNAALRFSARITEGACGCRACVVLKGEVV